MPWSNGYKIFVVFSGKKTNFTLRLSVNVCPGALSAISRSLNSNFFSFRLDITSGKKHLLNSLEKNAVTQALVFAFNELGAASSFCVLKP